MKHFVYGNFFIMIIVFWESVIGTHIRRYKRDIITNNCEPAIAFCKIKGNNTDSYGIRRIYVNCSDKIERIEFRTILGAELPNIMGNFTLNTKNHNDNFEMMESLNNEDVYFYDENDETPKPAIPITRLQQDVKTTIIQYFEDYILDENIDPDENTKFVKIIKNYIMMYNTENPNSNPLKRVKREYEGETSRSRNEPTIKKSKTMLPGSQESSKVENIDQSDEPIFFSESVFKNVYIDDKLLSDIEITKIMEEFFIIFREYKEKILELKIKNGFLKIFRLDCCDFFLYEINQRFDGFDQKMKMNSYVYDGMMKGFNYFKNNSLFSLLLPEFILFDDANSKRFFQCDEEGDIKLKDIFILELTVFFIHELFLGPKNFSSNFKYIYNPVFFFEIRAYLRFKIAELATFVWKDEFLAIYIKLTVNEMMFRRTTYLFQPEGQKYISSINLDFKNRNLHSCLMRFFFKIQSESFLIEQNKNQSCSESENQKIFNIKDFMAEKIDENINDDQSQITNTPGYSTTRCTLSNMETDVEKYDRIMKKLKEETSKRCEKYKFFVKNSKSWIKNKENCKNTMEKIIGTFFFFYLSHDRFSIRHFFRNKNRKFEFLRFVKNLIVDYRKIKPDVFKNLNICFDENDLNKINDNKNDISHPYDNLPCIETTLDLYKVHNRIDKILQDERFYEKLGIISSRKIQKNKSDKRDNKDKEKHKKGECIKSDCFLYQCFNMLQFFEIEDFIEFEKLFNKKEK